MTSKYIKQHTSAWHHTKLKYFGANDIATILDNGFDDCSELVMRKIDFKKKLFSESSTKIMNRGTIYEDFVRDCCAKRHGVTIKEIGLKHHDTYEYITASPDGIALLNGVETLFEFKVRKNIGSKIPFKYWIQMMIQMAVFNISQCLYCENIVDDELPDEPQLVSYHEHLVKYDHDWFQKVHPRIKSIWDMITFGRHSNHPVTRAQKRSRVRDDDDELDDELGKRKRYSQISKKTHFDVKDTVLKDRLIGWLNKYGSADEKDEESIFSFKKFVHQKSIEFKKTFNSYMKTKINSKHFVDVDDIFLPDAKMTEDIECDPKYISFDKTETTRKFMKENIPVIFNARLRDEEGKWYGKADILLRRDWLHRFDNMFDFGFIEPTDKKFQSNNYCIILVKYSTLNLTSNGIYLLNNAKHKLHKSELTLLKLCLAENEKENVTDFPNAYIVGRKSSFTASKIKYKYDNVFSRIGVIDYETKDNDYLGIIDDGMKWSDHLENLKEYDPFNDDNEDSLLPNMKNQMDYPWHSQKKKIADHRQDLTLMYRCGTKQRDTFGVNKWTKIPQEMVVNAHTDVFLEANKKKKNINLHGTDFISKEQIPVIEFFVDFETVSDLDDSFAKFPEKDGIAMVYMIGCITVNNETGKRTYDNYLVDRLCEDSEEKILKEWLWDMSVAAGGKTQNLYIYHWTPAENWILKQSLVKYGLIDSGICLIDLCKIFKQNEIALSGTFGYGLKNVAGKMYENKMIETKWKEKLDGLQAMVAAWLAEKECKEKDIVFSDVSYMDNISEYNYVDCKVLDEILTYIRST